jgi:cyanophycinase-like exopeptidase
MESEGEKASYGTPRCLLLGSGEFLPWVGEGELEALRGAGGDGSVVVLATASAPEGETVFARWNRMGRDHYAALGLHARALPVRTREDAAVEEYAEAARRASLIFFSGGNPQYLARSVERTPLWTAIVEALHAGSVYAGCSAGAMVAGSSERSGPARGRFQFSGGLGLCPGTVFGVHWDSTFMRLLSPAIIRSVPAGHRLIGISERTAILSTDQGWKVFGAGTVEVRDGAGRRRYRAGELIPGQSSGWSP